MTTINMAYEPRAIVDSGRVIICRWNGLAQGDVGQEVKLPGYRFAQMQVIGAAANATNVDLEAYLDPANPVFAFLSRNWTGGLNGLDSAGAMIGNSSAYAAAFRPNVSKHPSGTVDVICMFIAGVG